MTTPPPVNGPLPEGEWRSPLCASWCRPGDIPERRLRAVDLGDIDEWEAVCWQASELLFAATGRQFRGEPGRVRDSRFWVDVKTGARGCLPGGDRAPGDRVFGGYAGPGDAVWASVHHPRRIRLPDPDVTDLLEVTIDGQDVTDYCELDGSWLHHRRGFPVNGTETLVSYRFGKAPGRGGVRAAADLAVELARWRVGDSDCQLPNRITSVTREAVTYAFADPQALLEKGFTGIAHIDQWIRAANPSGRAEEARIISVDLPTAR